MARKTDPVKLNNAVQLYLSGKTSDESAAEVGISKTTLCRELKLRGIEARGNRVNIDAATLHNLYVVQELSELEISQRLKMSRPAVRRNLKVHGIHPRSHSEAGRIRMSRLTTEERQALSAAAHEAVRGRTRSWEERCKLAASREADPSTSPQSPGEEKLAQWLQERGIAYTPQKAIGAYNLDFAMKPVAVEILGGTWHAGKRIHRERTPYILDRGWLLIFVWDCAGSYLTSEAADYIVATLEEARRDPSLIGEYRVIRGNGELLSRGRVNDDSFTLVQPSIRGIGRGSRD